MPNLRRIAQERGAIQEQHVGENERERDREIDRYRERNRDKETGRQRQLEVCSLSMIQ